MSDKRASAAVAKPQPATAMPAQALRSLGDLRRQHGAFAPAPRELASVRRFRAVWADLQANQRVGEALARRPRNAGPLNSHALVLQLVDSLQATSPAYLRRLVDLVETMGWLERASERPATKTRKPASSAAAKRRR
ncbi:MAG: DUF2894 domain-containing protein [Ramlibacter sp.]